jgi:uncharacterized protein
VLGEFIVIFEKFIRAAALALAVSGACFTVCGTAAAETRPPLYDPIQMEEVAKVRAALQNGSDVNATYNGETLLLRAIRTKNIEIIKLLLAAPGIDVNKRGTYTDDMGSWTRTPLILAAHMGQVEIVSQLLKMGAAVNAKDSTDDIPESRGDTALIKAAQRDHTEVIRVFLTEAKGLDINFRTRHAETALWFVAAAEDLPAVKMLRERGAVANVINSDGQSVLVTTVLHKQHEVLDYLISQGVDINHVDNTGVTPLIQAVMLQNRDNAKTAFGFIQHFLTFKPKIDLQQNAAAGNGGFTALHMAARWGHPDTVGILLDNGATLELKSLATGATALHYATLGNQIDTVKFLIKRKANTEAVDKLGTTPLTEAVQLFLTDMVAVLADAGANLNVRSKANALVTPLTAAAGNPNPTKARENLAIMNTLLAKGADVDFASSNGTTALMAAARQTDNSLGTTRATLLINKGAKLDLTDDRGQTALMLAAGAGNEKLVKLLMDKGANAQAKNGAGETAANYAKRAGRGGSGALDAAGVQATQAPVATPVSVSSLIGTWSGTQEGIDYAVMTLSLTKGGTYSFTSKFTAAALKKYPKGINPLIAAHQGTYTVNGDVLVLYPSNAAPVSFRWVLEKGVLVLDGKTRMKKGK